MSTSHFERWFDSVDQDGSNSIDMVEIVAFLKELTNKDESFIGKFDTGKKTPAAA